MKVMRRMQIKTENFCVGDQISMKLEDFGKFSATVEIVKSDRICVLFDNTIVDTFMNVRNTTEGGYEKSDIRAKLYEFAASRLPREIRDRLISIELPTFGQVFGHNISNYKYYTVDGDEQFLLLKDLRNRMCTDVDDILTSWWLQNIYCPDGGHGAKDVSSANFANVNGNGNPTYDDASSSLGVRPVLWLEVKPLCSQRKKLIP